jgi:2-C-methyl-D-erythritol 4-phosphate cytidylyltransferase/2-C-methyl-D-erythritol 2,4-cyclodiphosphate synthase
MPYTVMMVAAAGGSTRMGQPKQHILLGNRPVLIHTLMALQQVEAVDEILLIARQEDIDTFMAQAKAAGVSKLRTAVAGGATRQASVANGLAALPPEATMVGIHDGARPLIDPDTVAAVIETAEKCGAAAVAVPVKDTLKRTNEEGVILDTPDRANLWRVQTPQVFDRAKLCAAMEAAMAAGKDYTDDCQLMEAAGHQVKLVKGLDTNLKLTTPEDIALAQALMKERSDMRIGHGYDVHKLVEGRDLILGGVKIEYEKGLLGHSDADVLTHAVMDALLGAAALGDIGKLFPDNDPAYKGADSIALLRRVVERLNQAGQKIGNIDATILCQRPKLAPHIPQMRQILADACGVDVTCVSVKATTEEGLGFTGSGEGIAAHCVCLLG